MSNRSKAERINYYSMGAFRMAAGDDRICTLEQVAYSLGVTKERARMIEMSAIRKCRRWCDAHGVDLDALLPFDE